MNPTDQTFSDQIGARLYCVRNTSGEYWSNSWGWIELVNPEEPCPYDVFTEQEKGEYNLPIGGHWETL